MDIKNATFKEAKDSFEEILRDKISKEVLDDILYFVDQAEHYYEECRKQMDKRLNAVMTAVKEKEKSAQYFEYYNDAIVEMKAMESLIESKRAEIEELKTTVRNQKTVIIEQGEELKVLMNRISELMDENRKLKNK